MSKVRPPAAIIFLVTAAAVSAGISGCADSLGTTLRNLYIVDAPVFDPAPGNHGGDILVSISSTTPGAEIWYTTDGSEPTRGEGTSTRYTAPQPIGPSDGAVRFFAKAFRDNMTASTEVIAPYSVSYAGPSAPALQITPVTDAVLSNGYWTGAVTVQVTGDSANNSGNLWNDSGLTPLIYYTVDGTLPDSGSSSVSNAVHDLITITDDGADVTVNALTGISGSTDYPSSPADTERIRIRYDDRAADPAISAQDGGTAPSVLWGEYTLLVSNGGSEHIVVESQTNGGAWTEVSTAADGDQLITIFSSAANGDVVNLRAWAEGDTGSELGDSDVVTASFSFVQGNLAKPTITPQTGTFTEVATITVETDVVGGTIRYTIDGSPPTTGSTIYTGPFDIEGIDVGYGGVSINAIVEYAGAVSTVRSAYIIIEDIP